VTPNVAFRRGSETKPDLPAGKTCGDCEASTRCCSLFGRIPEDEVCDWSPSRFRERAAVAVAALPPLAEVEPVDISGIPVMHCRICGGARNLKAHSVSQFVTVIVSACNVCLSTQVMTDAEVDAAAHVLTAIDRHAMGRAW
jgi:hypothetical protein